MHLPSHSMWLREPTGCQRIQKDTSNSATVRRACSLCHMLHLQRLIWALHKAWNPRIPVPILQMRKLRLCNLPRVTELQSHSPGVLIQITLILKFLFLTPLLSRFLLNYFPSPIGFEFSCIRYMLISIYSVLSAAWYRMLINWDSIS